MKIVVLDGYGLNPGDLSWEEMQALGELTSRLRKRGASLSPTYLPTAPLPLPRWSLRIY